MYAQNVWHTGCLQILIEINKIAMNICIYTFVGTYIFKSMAYIPMSITVGSYELCIQLVCFLETGS